MRAKIRKNRPDLPHVTLFKDYHLGSYLVNVVKSSKILLGKMGKKQGGNHEMATLETQLHFRVVGFSFVMTFCVRIEGKIGTGAKILCYLGQMFKHFSPL